MTYASEVLADSPYAYYKLDESSGATTAVDSSGNARDMTHARGAVAFGTAQLIVDGVTCGTFDTADELAFSNTSITTGGLTIEAWVKTTNNTTARGIIGWHNSGNIATKRFTLEMLSSGIVQATVQTSSGSAVTLTSTTAVNNGNPHHVVLTTTAFSGGTIVLYVDGAQEDTDTATTGTAQGANRMRLGGIGASGTCWSGDIDEGAFYNSALSAGRVSDHYDAGVGSVTNDLTVAGSFPLWTGTLSGTPIVTGSLAGSLPLWTGSIDAEPTEQVALAGSLPLWTGSIDVDVTVPSVEVELAGDFPLWTGDIAVQLPVGVVLTGDIPAWTGALNGEVNALDLQLDGDFPLWEGELAGTIIPSTDTHNRSSGRHRRAYAVATWEPPIVAVPVSHDYEVAVSFNAAPTIVDGRLVMPAVTEARAMRHRDRIVVGGKDITMFRGVPTPTPEFRLIQPLSYGSGTLELPQVNLAFERPGHGALTWLKPDAVVKVQRVDTDPDSLTFGQVVAEDYRGIITKFDSSGPSTVCTIGGEIAGRSADRIKPGIVVHRRKDGGNMLADLVRPVALRPLRPRYGPDTGITLNNFGSMGWLEAISQTVTMLTTRAGAQRTVVLDETDGVWRFPFKDTTTIHATAYIDGRRLAQDLSSDTAEEPNRIYATGIDDEGRKVKFAVYPGLIQGDRPDFPNTSGPINPGDTDEDTDSGEGVTVMMNRLIALGYTDRRESADMAYDEQTEDAIKDLQDDAGLSETGVMNQATWRALWDLDRTGYSLKDAQILPAAQRSYTKPWLRTSSGALAQRNPDFDPHRRKVDRQVDMGPGHSRQQIKSWARGLLSFNESNWVGTLDCHLALVRGEHNPGDPLAPADVMSAREIRPGMNVWMPTFDGGTLAHVVGVQVAKGGRGVQLVLDTQARDTMPAWEAINRNRESRHSSARAWLDQYRSSTLEKDALITWDPVGGTIDNRVHCPSDRWTVFPVVAGQAGTVQRIAVETVDSQAEFVLAVFGRSIRPTRLDHLVPNPLSEDGDDRWSDDAILRQLQERVFLYSSGTHEQPLGYFPKAKTGEDGEPSGAPITGRHEDEASFSFHTFAEPVLYVAIYPDRDTYIKPGRIMWNQLEEGS